MQQRNADFDAFAAKYGGTYRPTESDEVYFAALRDHLTESANDHELQAGKDKTIITHFDFVASDTFNAVAFVQLGKGYIGLFTGLIDCLVAYFHAANQRKAWDTNPLLSEALGSLDGGVAIHLSTLALDFVFDHEVTHLKHGHVDWLVASGFDSAFLEYDLSLTPDRFANQQLLEFDADLQATLRALQMSLVRYQRVLEKPNRYQQIPYISNPKATFAVQWFALYSLFLNFDDNTWKDHDIRHRSHPPAAMRMALAMTAMHGFAFKYYEAEMQKAGIDKDEFISIFAEATATAIDVYCNIKGVKRDAIVTPWELSREELEYMENVKLRMYEVQLQLAPHARNGGLPPLRPRSDVKGVTKTA